MSYDKETRNLLARTVTACRRRLTEDVTDQLQGVYGLHPDGTILPLARLTHLTPDQVTAAHGLRDLLDHYEAGGSGRPAERKTTAYNRLVLEISFTTLNRLAALRLCEERGLVVECVQKGTASDGFRMFERISGGAVGSRYQAYRVFLECMYDELALGLGVLFDRSTPQSAVFPTERCLLDLLEQLNKTELTHLWTEDETIGWIYQYFNPPEERRAMREASQAPRNSRELAVRNQFFTPRYVVEFLTDNTLGRIWYEMRRGATRLGEQCRYLVRRPNEVFLDLNEKAPDAQDLDENLSQDELLRRPVYIDHRPKKDPRDLKVLDPACGSGHFLLYAFDLFETIYLEAWNDDQSPASVSTGSTLQEDYPKLEELLKETPRLIIEHNLYGIDIDSRAVQIAALALWLRAQKSWMQDNCGRLERPMFGKSNIVTAEPMPGEEDMRREFVAGLHPPVLGQIVDEVFDQMKLAGEAGSLLKIEEDIKDAVAEARKQWVAGPVPEQEQFGFGGTFDHSFKQQKLRFDVSGITDEEFWDDTEDLIVAALKEYAQQADSGRTMRRRLFAQDASRGFAFVDLCKKRYDVVLMNPPFGNCVHSTFEYLSRTVPYWCSNAVSAFVGRIVSCLQDGAKIGLVTDRTVLIKSSYEDFRIKYLLDTFALGPLVDLGWNVLDANVEVSALILTRSTRSETTQLFLDCRSADNKETALTNLVLPDKKAWEKKWLMSQSFLRLPNSSIAHDMPEFVIRWFNIFPALRDGGAKALQGHAIKMDWYARLRWEIDPGFLGVSWSCMYNGGPFSRFYLPLLDLVRWNVDGTFLKSHPSTRWSNAEHQLKPGIGYGKRGYILDAHLVPTGHVFTVEGLFVIPDSIADIWYYLGVLNSPLCSVLLNYYCGQHKHAGYVDLLPIPITSESARTRVAEVSLEAWTISRDFDKSNELSPVFVSPWYPAYRTNEDLFQQLCDNHHLFHARVITLTRALESVIEDIYNVKPFEREQITSLVEKVTVNSLVNSEGEFENALTPPTSVHNTLSYLLGGVFGRWDVRVATNSSLAPRLPDPFDPLPVCPPGMLVNVNGLPAKSGGIVSEEWLRARPNATSLPPEDTVKKSTIPDSDYPLHISWEGIMVDDPGSVSSPADRDDIVHRVRGVLDLLWGERASDIEQEACEILQVADLRDYFRKPSGFFQDHLKRYSKSRRKAPIYWPLSTASSSYTLWIYYHRLTDQTLYTAVNKYVEPKIAEVERTLSRLEDQIAGSSGRDTSRLGDQLRDTRGFLGELNEFRDELLRVAGLPYKPDLNDGVIINAAPLHRLFRLRSWAKDTEECWKKLQAGEYDWAHMAYVLWPERVRDVCKRDRSIAIAHGLEEIYQGDTPATKKKGGRRKKGTGR